MTKKEKDTLTKEIKELQEWMKDSCGENVQEEELPQIIEDVATEVLNLSDDIPTLVVCDVLLDVFHDPEEQLVGVLQFLYQLIHSLLLHLLVVESDAQVGSEVEFSCQVAKHTLEEGVDGLYTEVVVVVDEVAEGCSCVVNDQLL